MAKKQYLIVGSDNKWYASCIAKKSDAIKQALEILDGSDAPETIYIYVGIEAYRLTPDQKGE